MSTGPSDWLKIPLKFRGKCISCGREIPSGDVALWSKTTKSIKHVSCETAQQSKEGEKTEIFAAELQLECFICGGLAGCTTCSLAQDCDRLAVSQACICENCFGQGTNSYASYQQAFLKKMSKITKVKI